MLTLSCDLKSGAIMTFIDVLVNVFDGFDRSANLHIDVTIWRAISIKEKNEGWKGKLTKLGRKIRIMGNNISIIMKMTSPVHKGPTVVRSGIFRIATASKESLWFKLLWIML